MDRHLLNRRALLGAGAAAAAAPFLDARGVPAAPATTAADPWRGLKIGVASYTFRKQALDGLIRGTQRVGLKYVSIKDSHLPMKSTPEERKAVGQKLRDAGITPLSCGVIYLPADEPGMRAAFEYARDLGVPTIVCSPQPGTFDVLDRLVKEFEIRLANHNHGPGDKHYPNPDEVM